MRQPFKPISYASSGVSGIPVESSAQTTTPNTEAFRTIAPTQIRAFRGKTKSAPAKNTALSTQPANSTGAYSLEPREVKRVMDAKFTNQPYDEKQFLYYHLHRNYFNVKNVITTLTKVRYYKYVDNLGNVWTELYQYQNLFHMPARDWARSILPFTKPFSRKFICDDDVSGVGGEFELIIRQDGKRVDAHTNATYQESYNYGRTESEKLRHYALDMKPHDEKTNYVSYGAMGYVTIQEESESAEQTTPAQNQKHFNKKLLTTGAWNGDAQVQLKGGQGMVFKVKNLNILGTTILIRSNLDGNKALIIPPLSTMDIEFSCFGSEPLYWTFDISTNSDAFIVTWELYSTWSPQ